MGLKTAEEIRKLVITEMESVKKSRDKEPNEQISNYFNQRYWAMRWVLDNIEVEK